MWTVTIFALAIEPLNKCGIGNKLNSILLVDIYYMYPKESTQLRAAKGRMLLSFDQHAGICMHHACSDSGGNGGRRRAR